MLGRLSEEQMDNYRQEVDGNGLSSYPHPWLMPDFGNFPVSMGLGPLMAIYQARFMKYLEDRNLLKLITGKFGVFLAMVKLMSQNQWVPSELHQEKNR